MCDFDKGTCKFIVLFRTRSMCCAVRPHRARVYCVKLTGQSHPRKIPRKILDQLFVKPAAIILQAFVSLFTLHNEARAWTIALRADAS